MKSLFKRSKKKPEAPSQPLPIQAPRQADTPSQHLALRNPVEPVEEQSAASQKDTAAAELGSVADKHGSLSTSPLCEICRHIDFDAILTPRTYGRETDQPTAFLRPQISLGIHDAAQRHQGTMDSIPELPVIRTAHYSDLSDSEGEDYARPYKPVQRKMRLSRRQNELQSVISKPDSSQQRNPQDEQGDGESLSSVSTFGSYFMDVTEIDIKTQAERQGRYHPGEFYNLGSIFDVRSRRHECRLCRRLWKRMRNEPVVKNQFMAKSRAILKLIDFSGRRHCPSKDRVCMLNLHFVFGWKIELALPWTTKFSFILQGRHYDSERFEQQREISSLLTFEDNLYGEARFLGAQCNFKLFRSWLRECETKHNHQLPIHDGPLFLRLIDVHRLCIVEWKGTASAVPRFVALSYTWGESKPKVQLSAASLANMKQPRALDVPMNHKLADAIVLTRNIGEQYIWIDCLAIMQDSPEDLFRQIPQMHHVYARSVLTIVSGIVADADHGLPGVSPRGSGTFTLQLPGIKVSTRATTKIHPGNEGLALGLERNYIRGARYLTRAWTYQEGYLAPRVLVFAKEQVYWECDRCTWCEETHWESSEINYVGQRAIKQAMPQEEFDDAFDRQAYDLNDGADGIFDFDSDNYAAIVKEYTSRNLSMNTDIMHACSGILVALSQRDQTFFVHGLRTRFFGNDLLFNITVATDKRFTAGTQLSETIPSWTWAYWDGPIEVSNQPRHNSYDIVENLVPCDGVKCYLLKADQDTGAESLEVINEDGGWRFKTGYIRTGEGIYDPAEDAELSSPYGDDDNKAKKPRTAPSIPVYTQDLTIDDIRMHRHFYRLVIGYHLIFCTFASLVVVRTEIDEMKARMQDVIIGGTTSLRGNGVWSNRDVVQRQVYVVRRSIAAEVTNDVPVGYEIGPCIGNLPSFSQCWDPHAYSTAVPDGLYVLLWMNNNQLPMFGHLLCRPKDSSVANIADWKSEILERKSGVTGATHVLPADKQALYEATWHTIILG